MSQGRLYIDSNVLERFSGECQCCLEKSNYLRSMWKVYPYKGELEIYGSMLQESLLIDVIGVNPDALICGTCIHKIRDIVLFKRQVENNLKNFENADVSKDSVYLVGNMEMKIEYLNDEVQGDDTESSHEPEPCQVRAKGESLNSDILLQRAVQRTKTNIKLLKSTLESEGNHSDDMDISKLLEKCKEESSSKNQNKDQPYKYDKTDRLCKICMEHFPTYTKLVRHTAVHYPNHICNYCGKAFVVERQLNNHIKFTHGNNRVTCPVCNLSVKKTSYQRHARHHTGNSYRLKCWYCPEQFKNYRTQIFHMVNEHNHEHFENKCNMCSKVFILSSDLNVHVKEVHLKEKNHKCSECEMSFFKKKALKMHMVKHSDVRNFECDICHKAYKRRCHLTEHMKIHNNVKVHICLICEKAFTQKCTLQAHVRIHDKAMHS